MKPIRFSPWLMIALVLVLVFAAGCNRPDPQVEIATPVPQSPQQPVQPQAVGTAAPGAEATPTLPVAGSTTDLGVTTPGAPSAAGTEAAPAAAATPENAQPQTTTTLVPTVVPPAQPTPQVQPTAAAPGTPTVHTVASGETLYSIGRLYNVNPYAIAAANNIPYPYIIYPGQQLTIPTGTTPPPPGTNPTPVPPASGSCRFYHRVLPGENLFRISTAYGVPMSTIAAANGIVNYNLIYAGQTLCIP